MYRHSSPQTKLERELGHSVQTLSTSVYMLEGMWETVYRHSGPLSKGQRGGGTLCIDIKDLYPKVRGKVGTQCIDTQDLYVQVRRAVGTQCTDTQDFYLKVRGEVGDSVQSLRTSI